jgi:uncharacterized protein (TIGR03083 family)
VTDDPAALYAESRARIVELVGAAGVDATTRVPACPAWTVGDVVAHLAGVTADIAAGRIEGAATDEWTARQVAERRGRTIAESLAEWDEHAGAVDAVVGVPVAATMLVTDVYSHEQDLRGALGVPGARDAGQADFIVERFLPGWGEKLRDAGLPALRVRAGALDDVVGEGAPTGSLRVTPWELVRAATGRRTPAQMRAYEWDGDPDGWIATLPFMGPAAADLVE